MRGTFEPLHSLWPGLDHTCQLGKPGKQCTHASPGWTMWWITRDGSLDRGIVDPLQQIPMEAVSPVMACHQDWEEEIETFWTAMRVIFHMPERFNCCGSHIHVSGGYATPFTLSQLKTIAFGVVYYEPLIQQLLMSNRTNNRWCILNSVNSAQLSQYRNNHNMMARLIQGASNTEALWGIMQSTRYVLWNFENIRPGKSGTVEFRGGRYLRGEVRTKRWIACTVSLIDAILRMVGVNNIRNPNTLTLSEWTPEGLYASIRKSSKRLLLDDSLPKDYQVLNESQR